MSLESLENLQIYSKDQNMFFSVPLNDWSTLKFQFDLLKLAEQLTRPWQFSPQ